MISSFGITTFKSPPSKMPDLSTVAALAISSAVSPDAGTITSPPLLYTEPSFASTYVSTSEMLVSYLVYNLPYKIIGVPVSIKSPLE